MYQNITETGAIVLLWNLSYAIDLTHFFYSPNYSVNLSK